jgi:hypothetical protein
MSDPRDNKHRLPTPAVECVDVIKTYGHGNTAVQAPRGVNLEVRNGELLMLVGPSGCGKTTCNSGRDPWFVLYVDGERKEAALSPLQIPESVKA